MTRTLLRWRVGTVRCALEFKPQDCWVGLYWHCRRTPCSACVIQRLDVWICLLPMLPMHYTTVTRTRTEPEVAP